MKTIFILIIFGLTIFLLLIFMYKNHKKTQYIIELESHLESKIKFASKKVEELQRKLNVQLHKLSEKRKKLNKKAREQRKNDPKIKVKIVKKESSLDKHDVSEDFKFLDAQIKSFEQGLKKLRKDK